MTTGDPIKELPPIGTTGDHWTPPEARIVDQLRRLVQLLPLSVEAIDQAGLALETLLEWYIDRMNPPHPDEGNFVVMEYVQRYQEGLVVITKVRPVACFFSRSAALEYAKNSNVRQLNREGLGFQGTADPNAVITYDVRSTDFGNMDLSTGKLMVPQ